MSSAVANTSSHVAVVAAALQSNTPPPTPMAAEEVEAPKDVERKKSMSAAAEAAATANTPDADAATAPPPSVEQRGEETEQAVDDVAAASNDAVEKGDENNTNTGAVVAAAAAAAVSLPPPYPSEEAVSVVTEHRTAGAQESLDLAMSLVKNGIGHCRNWNEAAELFFKAGSLFSLAGSDTEAAFAFLQSSNIKRALSDNHETMLASSFATDSLLRVDPCLAVNSLTGLSKMYVDNSLMLQAAKCEKDIAQVQQFSLGQLEEAITHYQLAMDYYTGAANGPKKPGQSKPTKEDEDIAETVAAPKQKMVYMVTPARAASLESLIMYCHNHQRRIFVQLGRYDEAREMFVDAARRSVRGKRDSANARGVARAPLYLFATLCTLAKGSGSEQSYFDALYYTKKEFDDYQAEDVSFQTGKEHDLLRGILSAYDACALNEYDLAVFKYMSISSGITLDEKDADLDLLIQTCRANLFEYLSLFM